MNTFITRLKPIFSLARTRNSRSFTHFSGIPVAFRCAIVILSMLAGAGVIQAQQKVDPLTITNTGNVGIGTTAPANKLSVAGNADFSGNVGIGTTAPVNKLSVAGNADVSGNVGIGTTTPVNKLSVAGNADVSGNVGIGTTTPVNKLSVAGNADFNGAVGIGTSSLGNSKFRIANSSSDFAHFRFGEAGAGEFEFVGWAKGWNINSKTIGKNLYLNRDANTTSDVLIGLSGKEVIVKGDTGNVGVGTTSPTKAKLEINGAAGTHVTKFGFLNKDGKTGDYAPNATLTYSVWASHNIAATEFHAFSDARIKNIQGRSDSATDLRTLLGIEVTDYRYKDVIGNGNGTYKKVTGQQVEKVFPQAVSKHTEVVPDIYKQASIQDGWITLATDLKKGERVKLITQTSEAGVHEVLEVAQDKFRIDFKPIGNRIFVYGREVNDFLTVDYGAISMLNVSATQQIKKEKDEEVKALQEENAILRGQLAEQEKRLAAIEALLLSGDKPAASSASLRKAN